MRQVRSQVATAAGNHYVFDSSRAQQKALMGELGAAKPAASDDDVDGDGDEGDGEADSAPPARGARRRVAAAGEKPYVFDSSRAQQKALMPKLVGQLLGGFAKPAAADDDDDDDLDGDAGDDGSDYDGGGEVEANSADDDSDDGSEEEEAPKPKARKRSSSR